jgi:hypothetical protein
MSTDEKELWARVYAACMTTGLAYQEEKPDRIVAAASWHATAAVVEFKKVFPEPVKGTDNRPF